MTDRELLVLAAETAGYKVRWHEDSYYDPTMGVMEDVSGGPPWNPLTYDGDAFRLLATMRASLEFDGLHVRVQCEGPADAPSIVVSERIEPGLTEGEDRTAAMRRAVTKAAATRTQLKSDV